MMTDHDCPSIWVERNGYQCVHLQDVIGDQWSNSESKLEKEEPEKITKIWLQDKPGFSKFNVSEIAI